MCGILGVCLDTNATRTFADIEKMKFNFSELLATSQVRGEDAAGIYIVNKKSDVVYFKAPIKASTMIDLDSFWAMLNDHVSENTVAIIGHTRAATTGDPEINENNHPIFDHPIIGVHNGVITNHLDLDKKYKKIAEVDSAAIMSLLRVKSKKAPLKLGTLTNNLTKLKGSFAIAVADTRKPDAIFVARNHNPVNFYRERDLGLLWFASTETILRRGLGLWDDDTIFEMPTDSACRIDSKAVSGKLTFSPIKRDAPAIDSNAPAFRRASPTVPRGVRTMSRALNRDRKATICTDCGSTIMTVYMGTIETQTCDCKPMWTLFND